MSRSPPSSGRPPLLLDELGLFTLEVFQKSREEVIVRQHREIAELSTPVVKLWDGILALPLIGTLDSQRTQVVMENLLQTIVDDEAEIAIIDITGVPTVDTLTAQHLLKTVAAARLMGADCLISGIRPQIAQTMVHLGVELNVISKASARRRLLGCPASDRTHRCQGQKGGNRRIFRPEDQRPRFVTMDRIPILKFGNALLVTIQVDMHDRLATALEEDLTRKIVALNARGVLIDISALEIVDSFIGRMLDNIAAVSRILDADTVVVGMRPAVAITLVELGLSLTGVKTALNVERGMALIQRRLAESEADDADERGLNEFEIRQSDDVVRVRQATRTLAVEVGLSLVDQTKIVTASSELARNTLDYGGGGGVTLEVIDQGNRRGLRLTFEDKGPGIADIEQALKDGFTTGRGMGLGLGGAKRLCNEFSIDSKVGAGTKVSIARWK